MPNNTQATTSQSEASQGEVIWSIAFWVAKNVQKKTLKLYGYDEATRLTEEIFSGEVVSKQSSENERLDRLLKEAEVTFATKESAVHEAVTYVLKGFCKFSSVHPQSWLRLYRDFVNEDADRRNKMMVDTVESSRQLVGA